ncbi:MAG TPA: transporter, partial [Alphaproteobacteria bacterium]|nr:transporter [Alphaproteobacteria bacterium]
FAVAIIVIEVSLQQEADLLIIMKKTGNSLAKNPLLIAPVLGALFMATGLNMPGPIDRFLELLGNAAAPCALVALGLFLAGTDIKNGIEKPVTLSMLVFYKLAVQPAVTWVIAVPILGMDPMASFVVVILSALPTGTGPFMLAVTYERDARMTGQAILISTCLSVVSISVLMAILPL